MRRMGLLSVAACALSACLASPDATPYTPDQDNDGFAVPQDCNDEDPLIHPDAAELCDGVDNNCSGEVDEGTPVGATTWFADVDGDGFGASEAVVVACSWPEGYTNNPTDCDDNNPDAFPGNDEVCDFADNDCDGSVDEGTALDAVTWYADADSDGYGSPYDAHVGCTQPTGSVANSEDCNDRDATLNPGAAEICDGLDNDCDGAFDEDDDSLTDATPYYPDSDGDGYGSSNKGTEWACSAPADHSALDGDCNDSEPTTSPGSVEICGDGADNNCDTVIDEETAPNLLDWYVDADGDGFGDPDTPSVRACGAPVGYAANDSDCDDDDINIYPEAVETWYDGIDSDCGEDSDFDADGDGFEGDGGEDCDDTSARVYPGHPDICDDGLDNDCDDIIDPCIRGLTLTAAAAGDRLGESVSGIGDFDGDGEQDFAVGASRTSTTGTAEGAVYLFTGTLSGTLSAPSEADTTFIGGGGQDYLGTIAGLGDIDGDGYADIAMGATGYDSAAVEVGAVYVHFGPDFGTISLATGADVVLYGERAYDGAGGALSSAGDFDGDGTPDTLAGVAYHDDGTTADVGAAYLILGEPSYSGVSLGYADVTFMGTAAGEWAGASVSGGGDLNNDGYDDLIIGAPYLLNDSGDYVGGAWVVLGEGAPSAAVTLSDADARLLGVSASSLTGTSVALAGDLNDDGHDDLLIGAPEEDTAGALSGAAYLVHGPVSGDIDLSDADAIFSAESSHDYLGATVSAAGDLNDDGVPDILIGASKEDRNGSDAGAAYIFLGPVSGAVGAGSCDGLLLGEAGSDKAGAALSALGDVDEDGIDDVIVGAPYSDAGSLTDGGVAWVLPGGGW